ncbi:hypothetical protein [Oceanobacillus sp. FSL H7-0719]|uniref:hypothetical protein n=1 Tax=Oceanobacillus sp. FSL H7-0719 TaxID=2954507 RepID=UPI003245A799
MSKLENLVNEFYKTEGLSLSEQVRMTMDLDKKEATEEMVSLFKYLEEKIG